MSSNDERFRNRAGEKRNAAVIKYAGGAATPKASFARPAGALTYDPGDIILPATNAPLTFVATREYATSFLLVKGRLHKSTNVTLSAAFALHLFAEKPTPVNPDGGILLCDKSAAFICTLDFFTMRAFSDGAMSVGSPSVDGPVCVELAEGKREIYGVLEARGNYVAGSAETFEVTLEVQQD